MLSAVVVFWATFGSLPKSEIGRNDRRRFGRLSKEVGYAQLLIRHGFSRGSEKNQQESENTKIRSLPFGELRSSTRTMQTVLLPFFLAGICRQETGILEGLV